LPRLQKELGVLATYQMTEVPGRRRGSVAASASSPPWNAMRFKEFALLRQQVRTYEELLANDKNIRQIIRDDPDPSARQVRQPTPHADR